VIISEKGYLGLAPMGTQEGDAMCIVPGASVPFILRKDQEPNLSTMVGESYVHGVMDGELVKDMSQNDVRFQKIEIR